MTNQSLTSEQLQALQLLYGSKFDPTHWTGNLTGVLAGYGFEVRDNQANPQPYGFGKVDELLTVVRNDYNVDIGELEHDGDPLNFGDANFITFAADEVPAGINDNTDLVKLTQNWLHIEEAPPFTANPIRTWPTTLQPTYHLTYRLHSVERNAN